MSKLTTKARKKLPEGSFVFPGERRYPIHDEAHARNALARASGKPEESRVRAAVHSKYPGIGKEAMSMEDIDLIKLQFLGPRAVPHTALGRQVKYEAFSDELSKIAAGGKWGHIAEVAGLGTLAAPHAYNAVTGKKASHKTERNTELAGLGILAAPSIKALMKAKHAHVKRANAKLIQQGVQTLGTGRAATKALGIKPGGALTGPAKKVMPSAESMLDKIRQAKASYGTPNAKPISIK